MKLRTLVSALAMAFATAAQADPSQFYTNEYTANTISPGKTGDDFLRVIRAADAWDRGWTGQGKLILIIDSGINADHKEFAGSIAHQRDFIRSRNGMLDVVGHGTGIAGIAAANWDGIGMAGVAPDAMLAIAKVTDNRAYNFSQARSALVWGNEIGAVVANISANYIYDSTYSRNWVRLQDGTYMNKDPRYVGRYFMGESADLWAPSLGTNMVLVNSAGNSGLTMPQQPGTLATATDRNGNLVLGGQVIIVGAWDIDRNAIATYSNKAGHVCINVQNNACADKYRVSDFYIMAPGNMFTPGRTGDTYNIQTGTSQAAAVVSGSVAVISEMWPTLKGAKIVELLMTTADKNIPGYNKDVHGQGLLDLERATRPVGDVVVPTVSGTAQLSGGFSTNTSGGLSSVKTKLGSVMVMDSFQRDFYVNMQGTVNNKMPRMDFDPMAKADFYEHYNPYHKLNYWQFNAQQTQGNYDVKFSGNQFNSTAMVEFGKGFTYSDRFTYRMGFGALNERDQWMGNSISGALGQVDGGYTTYTNLSGRYKFNEQTSAFGSVWLGHTQANLNTQGLITNVGTTQSYSWNFGIDYTKDQYSVGTVVSQPVTVYRGSVDINIPVALNSDGSVKFDRARVDISPNVQEYDLGVYYKYRTNGARVTVYGEHRMNYLNQAGVNSNVVGISLSKEF